jgi:hypothetical protein
MENNATTILTLAAELGLPGELQKDPARPAWIKNYFNGVKFELEYTNRMVWTLIVGHGDNVNAPIIRDAFEEAAPKKTGAWFLTDTPESLLDIAIRVRDYIFETGLTGSGLNRRTKTKTDDAEYFQKTAQVIELAVKLEHWDILERGGLGFDAHDGLITIGKSAAVLADPTAPTWREHLVPCVMLKDRAVEMFQEGATVPQVAQMLKANLAILIITQDEAKLVDSKYQTTMPEGWNWGDSVFARLDKMGVAY